MSLIVPLTFPSAAATLVPHKSVALVKSLPDGARSPEWTQAGGSRQVLCELGGKEEV